jgi:hypothetical protein
MNRLKIIAIEDIGIGCVNIIIPLNLYINKLKNIRSDNFVDSVKTLLKISNLLGGENIERTRMQSFVKARYYTKFQKNKTSLTLEEHYEINGDNLKLFKKLYENGEEFCFYYLFQILHNEIYDEKKKLLIPDPNLKKNVLKLFGYIIGLNEFEKYDGCYKMLESFYKKINNKDSVIFIVQAVLIKFTSPEIIDFDSNEEENIDSEIKDLEIVKRAFNEKIVLKKTFFDKHVSVIEEYKKIINSSNTFFAMESSKVFNESKLTNVIYKKMYEEFKKQDDKLIKK